MLSVLDKINIEILTGKPHDGYLPFLSLTYGHLTVLYKPTYSQNGKVCAALGEIERISYIYTHIMRPSTTLATKLMFIGEILNKFNLKKYAGVMELSQEIEFITQCIKLFKNRVNSDYYLFSYKNRQRSLQWLLASTHHYTKYITLNEILSDRVVNSVVGIQLIQKENYFGNY